MFKPVIRGVFRPATRGVFAGKCKTPAYHFTTGTDSLRLGELYTGNVQVYVMSPTGSNAGLPAGTPALTANKWQVITVTLSNSNLLVDSSAAGVDLYLYAFRYNGNTYYVNMGDTSTGYVGVLDGLTQYWSLSAPVALTGDFTIRFKVIRTKNTTGTKAYVNLPPSFLLYENQNEISAQIIASGGGISYPAIPFPDPAIVSIVITRVGATYTITVNDLPPVSHTTDQINTLTMSNLLRWYDDTKVTNSAVWDLEVFDHNGVKVVDIPMTDKTAGATQTGVNGTTVNATCVNYTTDIWRPTFE